MFTVDVKQQCNNNKKRQIKQEIACRKEGMVEEVANKVVDRFKSDVRQEVRKIDDQKSRAMNLVVFNLPESDKSSSAERKEDDVNRS